jgi:hypothetical protein
VNMVLGLPIIKVTGAIIGFIKEVVEAKHLNCPSFPINFCCAVRRCLMVLRKALRILIKKRFANANLVE